MDTNKINENNKNQKLLEIEAIYNIKIDLNKTLNSIEKKYKKDLDGFTYVNNINEIISLKKVFIKYVSTSGKLYNGGFYYKVDKVNEKFIILLVTNKKKIISVSFDDNYIYYKNIVSENEQTRTIFEDFLNKYT